MNNTNDYGLWGIALVNAVVFIGFAYSFFKPVKMMALNRARLHRP